MPEDELITKDFKLYDLCMRTLGCESLFKAVMFCITISYQLDEDHIERIKDNHKDFDEAKEMQYFEGLLSDLGFVRFLDKRETILSSEDPYQYFDELITDDPQDVFNFDEENEKVRLAVFLHIAQFLGKVMSSLAIEKDEFGKLFGH